MMRFPWWPAERRLFDLVGDSQRVVAEHVVDLSARPVDGRLWIDAVEGGDHADGSSVACEKAIKM